MNEDEYLRAVRRALFMLESGKREEIVREIKSDIDERVQDGESVEDVLSDMPSPATLRNEYIKLYGVSAAGMVIVSLVSSLLSLLTLSVFPMSRVAFYPAPVFLVLLSLYIVYLTYHFGRKVGLAASLSSAVTRLFMFFLTVNFVAPPLENGTCMMECLTSAVIAILPVLIKIED